MFVNLISDRSLGCVCFRNFQIHNHIIFSGFFTSPSSFEQKNWSVKIGQGFYQGTKNLNHQISNSTLDVGRKCTVTGIYSCIFFATVSINTKQKIDDFKNFRFSIFFFPDRLTYNNIFVFFRKELLRFSELRSCGSEVRQPRCCSKYSRVLYFNGMFPYVPTQGGLVVDLKNMHDKTSFTVKQHMTILNIHRRSKYPRFASISVANGTRPGYFHTKQCFLCK